MKERDKLELIRQLLNESAGSFRWSHEKLEFQNSISNKLTFEKVERNITGMFICTVVNVAGEASDSMNVSVECKYYMYNLREKN